MQMSIFCNYINFLNELNYKLLVTMRCNGKLPESLSGDDQMFEF